MENNIVLVRPTLELKEEALAYRSEHFQSGKMAVYMSEVSFLKTRPRIFTRLFYRVYFVPHMRSTW